MLANLGRRSQETWVHPFDMFRNYIRPGTEGDEEDSETAIYPVDVHEDDDKIYVEAELPGFRREDIDVSLQNDVLTIRAEREEKKQSHTQHLHERRYRRIHRRFTLPAPVDDETCDANYRDGVLHLEMTKHEDSKKRKIEIK